ncbi:putative, partial [Human papillomavirus type 60]
MCGLIIMKIIHFPIQIGNIFTIRMILNNGTGPEERWTIMDFISQKIMEIEHIFSYLIVMHKHIHKLGHGQCIIKTKLFLLLLPAPQNNPPTTTLPKPGSNPTSSPHPHRRLLPTEDRPHKRESLALPRRRVLFDYDAEDPTSNKENYPPESRPVPKDAEYPTKSTDRVPWGLPQLLKRWEADIDLFLEAVYQDLQDFKEKLGILQSC